MVANGVAGRCVYAVARTVSWESFGSVVKSVRSGETCAFGCQLCVQEPPATFSLPCRCNTLLAHVLTGHIPALIGRGMLYAWFAVSIAAHALFDCLRDGKLADSLHSNSQWQEGKRDLLLPTAATVRLHNRLKWMPQTHERDALVSSHAC